MTEPATSSMVLQDRIQERLKALGIKARRASILATGKPHVVKDILNGKAKSSRGDTLQKLTNVLECSVGYLLGDEPLSPGAPRAEGTTEPPRASITHADFAYRAATIARRAAQESESALSMPDRASDTIRAETVQGFIREIRHMLEAMESAARGE